MLPLTTLQNKFCLINIIAHTRQNWYRVDREYERRLVFLALQNACARFQFECRHCLWYANRIELATCGSINTVDNQGDSLSIFFIKDTNSIVDVIQNRGSHTDIWGHSESYPRYSRTSGRDCKKFTSLLVLASCLYLVPLSWQRMRPQISLKSLIIIFPCLILLNQN